MRYLLVLVVMVGCAPKRDGVLEYVQWQDAERRRQEDTTRAQHAAYRERCVRLAADPSSPEQAQCTEWLRQADEADRAARDREAMQAQERQAAELRAAEAPRPARPRPAAGAVEEPPAGCSSDFDCRVGDRCAKGRIGAPGKCVRPVDREGLSAPGSSRLMKCSLSTDCPAGFRCDWNTKVCMK